jgi:integrase
LAERIVRRIVEASLGGSVFTLGQLLDRYEAYSKATNVDSWFKAKQFYMKRIAAFFGDVKLSEITPYDCQRFYQQLTGSQSRINLHIAVLKNMFNMAVEWGMMTQNPARKIKPPHTPPRQRFLSDDEIQRLLAAARAMRDAPACKGQLYLYYFVRFALLTGMRRSEIQGLRWTDFRDGFVVIKRPKERKEKWIPVPPGLHDELKRLDAGREYLFGGTSKTGLNLAWHRACRAAGIDGATPHTCRHTFATRWAQYGSNLVALQHTLGHASLDMTSKYAHADRRDQAEIVAALEAQLDGAKTGPQNEAKSSKKNTHNS